MSSNDRRVVVTGLGAVTPLGLNVKDFWDGIINGKCGVGPITLFDASAFPVSVAAEVKEFEPTDYMDIKRADRTARCTQFAIAAAREAQEMAGLDTSREYLQRIGVSIATSGMISMMAEQGKILEKRGPKRVDPLLVNKMGPSMVPSQVALEIGARGPNTTVNSACASGSDSIGQAYNFMRLGYADVMITGGSETTIMPVGIAGVSIVGALTRNPDPATASRPFDLNRDGFVFGEGAGMLVMETLEHATARGATILAELAGAGWSFDCYNETAPYDVQQAAAMQSALDCAGMAPEEIDYVNAHGTSTQLNDAAETSALKMTLGNHAYKIPVSSNKSMIGHLACAAGSVEAVAAVKTITESIVPPTANYETPDPACDLDYVGDGAREMAVNTCLSNSFGMGGQNCSLVFRKYKQD